MKFGKLPPIPENDDLSHWCPFHLLEEDDYFPIMNYQGSCPNCTAGQYPEEFWGVFVRNDGIYHVFKAMEEVRCGGCGAILEFISVMCHLAGVDVTGEFGELGKKV